MSVGSWTVLVKLDCSRLPLQHKAWRVEDAGLPRLTLRASDSPSLSSELLLRKVRV